jgi:SNF2 family DNA or RNA helicase
VKALSDATAKLFRPIGIRSTDRLSIYLDKTQTKFEAHLSSTEFHKRPSAAASNSWTQLIPERKSLQSYANSWELAATDYTAELIRAHWSLEQLTFEEDAQKLYDSILLTTDLQEKAGELIATFKDTGEIPDNTNLVLESVQYPLARYQKVAAAAALANEGFGLFMEQGTGKTPIVVGVISTLGRQIFKREGRMARIVVVAPKNVRQNWLREVERFTAVGGKIEVVRGGEVARITTIIEAMVQEPDCEFTVVVMSYEVMVRSIATLQAIQWDLAVLDEGHFVKTPDAKRTRAAWKLRDNASRRMILTGTPVCNTPLDLYSQLEFLGRGYSGFQSWHAFKNFYGVYDVDQHSGHSKLVAIQNTPFMKERLARLSYICTKKEVMPELPDKVYDIDEVEMTEEQAKVYDQVAQEIALEIENELDASQNKAMTVNNILTKLLRLTQITSGYVVYDKVVDPTTGETLRDRTVEYMPENPKLERLVEILKDKTPDDKTIVWSCFVPDIETISKRLTKEGIKHVVYYGLTSDADRQAAEDSFNNDPSVKVLIGNQGAGGVGLNLLGYPPHAENNKEYTTNANHVIYYVQDWSHPKRSQSEDRCHRRGTRTNIRVTDLCVPDTIDEEIRDRVMKKKHAASELSDIREILQSVLESMKRGRDAA